MPHDDKPDQLSDDELKTQEKNTNNINYNLIVKQQHKNNRG
jgi:hypothetical protein